MSRLPIGSLGRVGVFWDLETCRIQQFPNSYAILDVVENIREKALRYGSITTFNAYSERSDSQEHLQHQTSPKDQLPWYGVALTHYPARSRNTAYESTLLVDLFTFALDNPAPATIFLLTGEEISTYAITTLRNRHYRVVLVTPQQPQQPTIRSTANEVLSWASFTTVNKPPPLRTDNLNLGTQPRPSPGSTTSSPSVSSHLAPTAKPSPTANKNLPLQPGSPDTEFNPESLEPVFSPRQHTAPGAFGSIMSGIGNRIRGGPWGGGILYPNTTWSSQPAPSLTSSISGARTQSSPKPLRRPTQEYANPPHHLITTSSPPHPSSRHTPMSQLQLQQPQLQSQPQPFPNPSSIGQALGQSTSSNSSSGSGYLMYPPHQQPPPPPPPMPPFGGPPLSPLEFNPNTQSVPLTSPNRPRNFDLLVQILREFRAEGKSRPYRSKVGSELVQRDRNVYNRAGVGNFKEYVGIAENAGIVRLGGSGSPGKETIELIID